MLQQAIAADPGSADVQRDLGIALMKAGRHEEAIQPLSKAVELEDRAELHQLLADAYKASGRLDESRAQSVLSVRAVERRKQERLRKMTAGR
jgi:Flp pilus assembly protein TadD